MNKYTRLCTELLLLCDIYNQLCDQLFLISVHVVLCSVLLFSVFGFSVFLLLIDHFTVYPLEQLNLIYFYVLYVSVV